MQTNNINTMKSNGFTLERTKDVNTVISHDRPFKLVREGKEDYAVPLNEDTNTYSVAIGGYPSGDTIAYDVVQYTTPLLFELNEAAKNAVADTSPAGIITPIKHTQLTFEALDIDAEFTKTASDQSVTYVKVDETTYVKAGNTIGGAIELIADKNDVVYVAEMFEDDINSLSIEQKQGIIDHAPEGLSPDDFAEYVAHDIENIPGLEHLEDRDVEQLIASLSQLYFNR